MSQSLNFGETSSRSLKMPPKADVAESKLNRISPLQVVNPATDLQSASRELLTEMQAEWEKDWSEIA